MQNLTQNITPAQATIIGSIIAGAVAIIVCLLNNMAQRLKFSEEIKQRDIEREKAEAVRDAKLEQWMKTVDKKLDQHNGYAEKFGEIGEAIAGINATIGFLKEK